MQLENGFNQEKISLSLLSKLRFGHRLTLLRYSLAMPKELARFNSIPVYSQILQTSNVCVLKVNFVFRAEFRPFSRGNVVIFGVSYTIFE